MKAPPQQINSLLDFLITLASERAAIYAGAIPEFCDENIEIFDELDSMNAEEFAAIYTVYLLGSGAASLQHAQQLAFAARFTPLIPMSKDPNLHTMLSRGMENRHYHELLSSLALNRTDLRQVD